MMSASTRAIWPAGRFPANLTGMTISAHSSHSEMSAYLDHETLPETQRLTIRAASIATKMTKPVVRVYLMRLTRIADLAMRSE